MSLILQNEQKLIDQKSHLILNKLIEKLRKEQSNTENILCRIETGFHYKKKKSDKEYDDRLFNIVKSFDNNVEDYIKTIILITNN